MPRDNLHRRHLTKSQWAAIGTLALPLYQAEAEARRELALAQQSRNSAGKFEPSVVLARPPDGLNEINVVPAPRAQTKSVAAAAKAVRVGESMVQKAAQVKNAAPEVFERIQRGEVSVNQAYREITPHEKY